MRAAALFPTPVAEINLVLDDATIERVTAEAKAYHYERKDRDAAFAAATGRHVISRPDLLDWLTPQDKEALLAPITDAVKEFIRVGLGDQAAYERKLAVRGFARVYAPGERITPHTHFDADVVVSIYLVPGGDSHRPAGNLVLIDPVVRGYPFKAPFHAVRVSRGLAVIFPGYLLHESEPTPAERVIAGLEYKVLDHDMQKTFTPI